MTTITAQLYSPHRALRSQIRIANESFAQSATEIAECATQYNYDPWRVRVIDMQRASVHLFDALEETGPLESATLILQANGFSFTTAQNASLHDRSARIVSPYTLISGGTKGTPLRQRSAQLLYEDQPVCEFDALRLYDIMSAVSSWYFERKDLDGNPLPEKVFVNPVANCALRCKPCSRLPFLNGSSDYMDNLAEIVAEISAQVPDRDELRVVNVSTGTLSTVEEDFQAFEAIITHFRKNGFDAARFSIATSSLFDGSQMQRLRRLGVDRISVTMDGTSDEALSSLYRGKGQRTVAGYSEMIRRLEDVFPHVAIHLILGHDSTDTIKRNVARLASQSRAALHHYIPRIFLPNQYSILHPEAVNKGLVYYVELFRFIDDLNDARMPMMDLSNPFYGLQGS